jgi:DNA-binding response OmpR family regulator
MSGSGSDLCDVLVCDDDEDLRETMVEVLAACGFRATSAARLDDAVRLAREHRPNVVLLDLHLRGGSAYDFVRADPSPGATVVLLSGTHDLEGHRRRLGVRLALPKPVGIDELCAVMSGSFAAGSTDPV